MPLNCEYANRGFVRIRELRHRIHKTQGISSLAEGEWLVKGGLCSVVCVWLMRILEVIGGVDEILRVGTS